jgi:hypothetical protein
MLPRFETRHDDVRVRPEGHGGDDRLDVLLLEHVPELGVVPRGWLTALGEDLVRLLKRGGVDVGHREHLTVGGIDASEQRAPLAADADEADSHRPPAHWPLHRRRGAKHRERRRARQRLQKRPPSDLSLFRSENHRGCSAR